MFHLLLITVLFQISNNYVINLINPYTAFFAVYGLATLVFLIMNLNKSLYKLDKYRYTIPVVILGQILAPLFYFKGVFLSDLFTQSLVYSLYPLVIIIFSNWYDGKKIFSKRMSLIYSLILLELALLINNVTINEGFWYLIISCLLLIAHKIIHKIAVIKEGKINEHAITFYGLLGSTLLGASLLINNGINLNEVFDFKNYINLETSRGLLFCIFLTVMVTILGRLQLKRNEELNKNNFDNLYLYILITPPITILCNNFLYFLDNKIPLDLSVYGLSGLLYGLLILIITRNIYAVITYTIAVFISLFMISINLSFLHLDIIKTNQLKVLYNDQHKFGAIKNVNGDWIFEKNKEDFDRSESVQQKINMNFNITLNNELDGQVYPFFVKDYIGSKESLIVYNINDYKKYILKEIPESILKNMLNFNKIAQDESFLVPYKIIKDKNKNYILMDYIEGMTFEDYFAQYNKYYTTNVNQKMLFESIQQVIEMNIKLMEKGWVNRDTHQKNILFTSKGIKLIDYDMIFPIEQKNIIDTNGMRNNLYDFLRLFYPKESIIANKFFFNRVPYYLQFNKDSETINNNLLKINAYIQDGSYYYDNNCLIDDVKALKNLLEDIKNIENKSYDGYISNGYFNEKCVNKQSFYNKNGNTSFIIYNLPSKYYTFNYIKIINFISGDTNIDINKNLLRTMQDNSLTEYNTNSENTDYMKQILSFIREKEKMLNTRKK